MLPFLKPRNQQTGIIQDKHLNGSSEIEQNTLESAIKDALVSISFKDIKMLTQNIKDIHDILHLQMDSMKSNTFNAQNIKAHQEQE